MEEADEVAQLVRNVVDSDGKAARDVYPRYRTIVRLCSASMMRATGSLHGTHSALSPMLNQTPRNDACACITPAQLSRYQEQPQLLDGILEGIVQPLACVLRAAALGGCEHGIDTVVDVCRLLYVLLTVRGRKTVVRFFPHEAADLERVLQVRRAVRHSCTHRVE